LLEWREVLYLIQTTKDLQTWTFPILFRWLESKELVCCYFKRTCKLNDHLRMRT